jgi:hypothetical protein
MNCNLKKKIDRRSFIQISLLSSSLLLPTLGYPKLSIKNSRKMSKKLSFSSDHIDAQIVEGEFAKITDPTIVFNATNLPLVIDEFTTILPWQSVILQNISFKPVRAILLRVIKPQGLASECLIKLNNLNDVNDSFPKEKMLYISSQDSIGMTTMNFEHFGGENFDQGTQTMFEVKLNLWYTPSANDCGIHTGH